MAKDGRVVLSGLFFDHDSVVLKDSSKGSLTTIAEYLKARPEKKYYVVGHTDTEGGFSYNQGLSQGRADAVLNALVDNYAVPKDALKAYGVSYAAPISSNASKNEREKNRRVELVEVNQF